MLAYYIGNRDLTLPSPAREQVVARRKLFPLRISKLHPASVEPELMAECYLYKGWTSSACSLAEQWTID